jgi:Helix-turn-helix domain
MHNNQQLWLSWGRGEIDEEAAQAAAEAAHGGNAHGQQNEPAAFPESRRGTGPREKVFGPGRCVPLDRNAKVRVMMVARALMRRQEKGKAYGNVTAKALAVLTALLWRFHNAASGKCFPSYEAIAEAAGCARSTVYEAIRALEQIGVLSWVNRIKRVREYVPGLFGKGSAWRSRVVRTSNSYVLADPLASKSDFQTRTTAQDSTKKGFANNGPHMIAGRSSTYRALSSSETQPRRNPALF